MKITAGQFQTQYVGPRGNPHDQFSQEGVRRFLQELGEELAP